MNLSPNFRLAEFTRSDTAARLGIVLSPSQQHIENLTRLCVMVLEPARTMLREAFPGCVVQITSGFRTPELNVAIGGSKTSAHMDGRAADIEVRINGVEQDVTKVFAILRKSGLPFDQLIQECGPAGWNHIGIAKRGETPRGELLTATGTPGHWVYQRVA
jgi:hypothetical protein